MDIDRYSLLVAEYSGQNVPPEAGIQLPSSFLLGSLKYTGENYFMIDAGNVHQLGFEEEINMFVTRGSIRR